jgi:DNA-binding response OmpR family regulator
VKFAKQLKEDLAELGHRAIEANVDSESVDVIILDCRDTDFKRGFKHARSDKIVIAIVNEMYGLPTEALSEFTDIVFSPCKKIELSARIQLAAFRMNKCCVDDVCELDGFKINFSNYEVMIDGKQLDLTYKEYELLRHLAVAPGRVFTRSQLLKNVWGYDYIEGARTVDVHIRRLRSKLGRKHSTLIETVRHVGYRFKRMSY